MAESKNEEIEKAKKELEKLAMNPEDRKLYELRLKAIRDEMNIRYSGYIDGKADGMVEGEAKGKVAGKNERNIEIAQKMLKKSMKIEDIIELTGLSQEEIEKLK